MSALRPSDIEDLQEFVHHIHELARTRFAAAVLSQKTITLRRIGESRISEIVNFDEEDFRSFLLGCRLLLQDNERVSIGHVWRIFKDRIKDDAWFIRINPPRWMLNDFLDQETMFTTPSVGSVSNRLLLDTFLYGSYAHLNKRHRKRFRQWEAHDQYPLMKLLFLTVLQVLYKCSFDMASVVSDWLGESRKGVRAK
jgi:hypothetical protein